jgi:hypothetical protein
MRIQCGSGSETLVIIKRTPFLGKCIDTMGKKTGANVGLSLCHKMGGNQVLYYVMMKIKIA